MNTPQEFFTRVKNHLLLQGKRSTMFAGPGYTGYMCRYRSTQGTETLMCAVGCLIKDEHYSTDLEGLLVIEAIVLDALAASGIILDPVTLELLQDLQRLHDNNNPDAWTDELKVIAKTHNLDY